jgi:hypothetical protein
LGLAEKIVLECRLCGDIIRGDSGDEAENLYAHVLQYHGGVIQAFISSLFEVIKTTEEEEISEAFEGE